MSVESHIEGSGVGYTAPYSWEFAMAPLDSRAAPTLSKLKTEDVGDGTLMTVTCSRGGAACRAQIMM